MKYYRLEDLCMDVIDCPHSTPEWLDDGIPVIRNYNIKQGRLDFSKPSFVDEDTYKKRTARAVPEAFDIVISREAPMGEVAIVPPNFKCCLGQRIVLLKINKNICEPLYLIHALRSHYVQTQIKRIDKTGSIVSNLNIPDLKDLLIPLPEDNQNEIGYLFGVIDSKIELNNKINKKLWEILKITYDYWFTQYDFPNNDGKPYRSSGGKMIYNEMLKKNIPEGWKVQSLADNELCTLIKPGVNKFNSKEYYATGSINGTDILGGDIVDYETRESRANMQPTLYSIWFAKMKNSVKHLFLNQEMKYVIQDVVLSTGFCGLQCSEISFEYIAQFIENPLFELKKDRLAHGATQEAVNNDDLISIKIAIPPDEVLCAFHNNCYKLMMKISKNINENKKLFETREWLLPMLMNGQAKVEK